MSGERELDLESIFNSVEEVPIVDGCYVIKVGDSSKPRWLIERYAELSAAEALGRLGPGDAKKLERMGDLLRPKRAPDEVHRTEVEAHARRMLLKKVMGAAMEWSPLRAMKAKGCRLR